MVKKVLFIFHDTDYISGATLSMLDLIENFNKNENLSCMVLVPNKTGTAIDYLKSKKIPILYSKYYQIKYNLDERPIKKICHMPKNILKLIVSIVNTYRLIPLVKRNEIDVVYSNTGFVINGALIKKKLPYIKHIWHIREFGEEDHHYGIVIGRRLYYWIQNKYTDDIIYISNSLYKKFRPHIHKPSVHIIYDDISKIYYQEYERVYKKDDKMNILFAGTIQLGKGQMDAVRLLHRLVELKIPAQLSLAGRLTDIKYVNEIKEYIKKYDLEEYITFLGLVEDMNSLRHNTDFGIVSSRSEAFGRVTIEGMLSGMVMIGADANGTSELITNGKNGFLYRLGDINMLTEIFVNLWNNPDIVNNVSKAARSYSKKFIEGDCAKELTNIFMGE